jgi:hypothetical protein
MTRTLRLSLLAVVATALAACGGSGAKLGGGKEGAAKALFAASQPAGKGGNSSGQSLMRQMASGAATGAVEFSVDCASKGSVKLKLDLTSSGTQSGSLKYEVEYKDCNQDGVNSFDGKMTMEMTISGSATSLEMALKLKGKINLSGDISDYVDADITETLSATATSATSGSVTVKLNCSIKTSSSSYTYANESLTISAGGSLPADNGNS